jgi:hypothetical protein
MGLRKRATAELYTMPTRSALPPIQIGSRLVDPEDTLQWYADPDLPYGRFPPRGALLMNTSGIALAIFTQMDAQGVLCLSATEYDELLRNVKAVGPRSRSYLGGPRLLWRGRVRWGPHKNKMVDVYLELQPDRIDAVGRTDHAYTLQQGTVEAVLGRTRTRDPGPWGWSWSLSGRLAFPVKLVKDGSHKLTPAASLGYSKSKPHSQGLDLSGSSERLDIELSNHVWGNFHGV